MTLMYLANFYCGATKDMKALWRVAKEYEVPVAKLGERIITQMLFSEDMYGEEDIFLDYYLTGNAYFRLKQAYLAYVSREYVVDNRETGSTVFEIILNELKLEEDLADICKIALLRYYSENEYEEAATWILHQILREMCEKQLIFPFYLFYPESWLREVQIYDRTMVEYRAPRRGKVRIVYKMRRGDVEDLGYQSESLTPVYENIYVKSFVLYKNEQVKYAFEETKDRNVMVQEEHLLQQRDHIPAIGRFGKLNAMTDMEPAERKTAMIQYQQEILMAE